MRVVTYFVMHGHMYEKTVRGHPCKHTRNPECHAIQTMMSTSMMEAAPQPKVSNDSEDDDNQMEGILAHADIAYGWFGESLRDLCGEYRVYVQQAQKVRAKRDELDPVLREQIEELDKQLALLRECRRRVEFHIQEIVGV